MALRQRLPPPLVRIKRQREERPVNLLYVEHTSQHESTSIRYVRIPSSLAQSKLLNLHEYPQKRKERDTFSSSDVVQSSRNTTKKPDVDEYGIPIVHARKAKQKNQQSRQKQPDQPQALSNNAAASELSNGQEQPATKFAPQPSNTESTARRFHMLKRKREGESEQDAFPVFMETKGQELGSKKQRTGNEQKVPDVTLPTPEVPMEQSHLKASAPSAAAANTSSQSDSNNELVSRLLKFSLDIDSADTATSDMANGNYATSSLKRPSRRARASLAPSTFSTSKATTATEPVTAASTTTTHSTDLDPNAMDIDSDDPNIDIFIRYDPSNPSSATNKLLLSANPTLNLRSLGAQTSPQQQQQPHAQPRTPSSLPKSPQKPSDERYGVLVIEAEDEEDWQANWPLISDLTTGNDDNPEGVHDYNSDEDDENAEGWWGCDYPDEEDDGGPSNFGSEDDGEDGRFDGNGDEEDAHEEYEFGGGRYGGGRRGGGAGREFETTGWDSDGE